MIFFKIIVFVVGKDDRKIKIPYEYRGFVVNMWKKAFALFAVLAIATTGFFTVTQASVEKTSPQVTYDVMYLAGNDKNAAKEWCKFVNSTGMVGMWMFADDMDIMITLPYAKVWVTGYDTVTNWASDSHVMALKRQNKPVIGMCAAGSAYFEAAGQSLFASGIGKPVKTNEIYALETTSDMWTKPNSISIPISNLVPIHTTAVPTLPLALSPVPKNVTVFGKADAVSAGEQTLAVEADKYCYWAYYTMEPSNMTIDGKALFENAITYLLTPRPPVPELNAAVMFCVGVLGIAAIMGIVSRRKD